MKHVEDSYHSLTRSAFLWSRILRTPIWAIYGMLPFILYRDLHATPFQIAVMVALKPTVSLISMYWSALINKRRDRLVPNIIWANILGLAPFFFFPFINNPWFFIGTFALFMMLYRGVNPAWMEVLKLNLPDGSRERIFAYGSTLGYVGDGVLWILYGWLLDSYFQSWRWIFPATAIIALISIYFQLRIPIRTDNNENRQPASTPSLTRQTFLPWKNAWKLICSRSDFRWFQMGFMLGGAGLMVMHPVLPEFFMGVLNLSYKELGNAIFLCKGIGFVLTSQIWARWMQKIDIYRFSGIVTLVAFLFPVCLLASINNIVWLFLAYIIYGIMQAGSELSWNLSGPIFAKDEDSSIFSSVNVVTVGLRGCIAPFLGAYLGYLISPSFALVAGGILCLLATATMTFYSRSRGTLFQPETSLNG